MFIPLVILNALEGKPLPVYGDGKQIRDWLYVDDHARALYLVVTQGKERRERGGTCERRVLRRHVGRRLSHEKESIDHPRRAEPAGFEASDPYKKILGSSTKEHRTA